VIGSGARHARQLEFVAGSQHGRDLARAPERDFEQEIKTLPIWAVVQSVIVQHMISPSFYKNKPNDEMHDRSG
jgi:hypothetical protein